jgi:hypothetical protein
MHEDTLTARLSVIVWHSPYHKLDTFCTTQPINKCFTHKYYKPSLVSLTHSVNNTSTAVWCVSYQSLSCSWHTDLDYGSYRLPDLEIQITAAVTVSQGILTPPRHLIPPLVYPGVRVCPILWFVFPIELMRSSTVPYLCHFIYLFSFNLLWITKD